MIFFVHLPEIRRGNGESSTKIMWVKECHKPSPISQIGGINMYTPFPNGVMALVYPHGGFYRAGPTEGLQTRADPWWAPDSHATGTL